MEREEQFLAVPCHESGHALVAKALEGEVLKQTVVPEGDCLGYVLVSFERFPLHEKISRMMATLAGGFVAEEKIGKRDHSGCGSDMDKLDFLASYASRFLYCGQVSAEHLKSRAFTLASQVLSSLSLLH